MWDVPNLNPFGGSHEEPASGHSAENPIELMRKSILNNTRIGASLAGREFRSATRDGIQIPIEFVLSIPVSGL